jgi:hypothetical protein
VTVVERFRFLHLAISLDQPNNLTTPFADISGVIWSSQIVSESTPLKQDHPSVPRFHA